MAKLPSRLSVFSKKSLSARVVISYIFDYVIIIASVIGFYVLDRIEPYHQHFSLENKSLQYPHAVHERVTIQQALMISILSPIIIILVYTLLIDGLFSHHKPQSDRTGRRKLAGPYRLKDRLWELNCGILGLLLSQGLTFVITQVLKNACGKPRPDLIDRCQPAVGSHDLPVFGLSNSTICRGDPALIKDGFRSWPSGHSSSSFAGLFYISLYLGGKLHIMDSRGEVWKTIIVMIPTLGAALIAVSRIMDARHHPFDVITGSLLGTAMAWASYRQYFPPLSEPWKKGRAYPIRSWGSQPTRHVLLTSNEHEDEHDTIPLRNIADEEQLHDRRPGMMEPSAVSIEPTPHPAALPAGVYNRRRDRDTYSSSSSEDAHEGFEMTASQYGRRPQESDTSYQPYDTGYHPATGPVSLPAVHSGQVRHLAGEA